MSNTILFDLEIRLLLAGLLLIVAIRRFKTWNHKWYVVQCSHNTSWYRENLIMIGLLFNIATRLASIEIIYLISCLLDSVCRGYAVCLSVVLCVADEDMQCSVCCIVLCESVGVFCVCETHCVQLYEVVG